MKRKAHYREPLQSMDLRCDYMYLKDRVKGKVKKILQKDTRRRLKNETLKYIEEDN